MSDLKCCGNCAFAYRIGTSLYCAVIPPAIQLPSSIGKMLPDSWCGSWQPESWRQITQPNTDADGSAESHVS